MGRHEEASRKNIDSSSTVTSNSCPCEPALLPDDVNAVTATRVRVYSVELYGLRHGSPWAHDTLTEQHSEAKGRKTGRA